MLDAYVIGHGIPELAAALELAEVGLRVRIAPGAGEASANAAGAAMMAVPDRVTPETSDSIRAFLAHVAAPIGAADTAAAGAESLAPSAGTNPALALVEEAPCCTLMRGSKGQWTPLPTPNIWGIPAVPMSQETVDLVGGRTALRAMVDRVRPVLTIGQTHKLGDLVRTRMGRQLLEKVVDPLVSEHFGVPAAAVDVAIAAPGLNPAVTRSGSLSGAVLLESGAHVARETRVRPAAGWDALRASLLERLALYNVQFGGAVAEVAELTVAAGAAAQNSTAHWRVTDVEGESVDVVALVAGMSGDREEPAALRELAGEAAALRPVLVAEVAEADMPVGALAAAQSHAMPVQLFEPTSVPGWTARYRAIAGENWCVVVTGPVGYDAGPESTGLAAVRAELPAIASARVSWERAPWPTGEAREGAAASLAAERAERPWLIRVGVGVHAGELSAAIGDARQTTVQLRRRLVGISD